MKLTLIAIAMSVFTLSYSQNCKFETNEMDKFTGKLTRITKREKIKTTYYDEVFAKVKRVGEDYSLLITFTFSAYKKIGNFSVKPGFEMLFLIENGETIKLNTNNNLTSRDYTVPGLPPVWCSKFEDVEYPITKAQIESLKMNNVTAIRISYQDDTGKQEHKDYDIGKKNKDDLIALIMCVI